MKNEKGSITLFVLIAMIFFLGIAMTAYVSASNKIQGQSRELAHIKESYGQDLSEEGLANLYESALPKYAVKFNYALPEEYQEVEYIKSTGTQYIDTEIKATNKTVVEAKLYTENTGNKNWFGGSAYTDSNNFVFNSWSANQFEYEYGFDRTWLKPEIEDTIVGTPFIVEFGNGKIKINNKNAATLSTNTFKDNSDMFIFARANGTAYIDGKLFYFKVYEDKKLIRDYIPCYTKSDDTIGLYDLVENKFYTNSGTGTFEKGNDASTVAIGKMQNQEFTYSKAQRLKTNTYTRTGYIFAGWNTKEDGTGTTYIDGQEVRNLSNNNKDVIDLYAQWEEE